MRSTLLYHYLPFLQAEEKAGRVRVLSVSGGKVGNTIENAGFVVGYKERTVRHYLYIDRPAPGVVSLQPPLGKWFVLISLVVLDPDSRYSVSRWYASIPGAVFRDEDAVLPFPRE